MLFERGGDPLHRDYMQLRAVSVSPWSGPKAILDEVEHAALTPGGLSSVICVVEGDENGTLNCLEAAPECMLRPGARRWR
eukprot:4946785-Alexandrium_andersonii.AAC.1